MQLLSREFRVLSVNSGTITFSPTVDLGASTAPLAYRPVSYHETNIFLPNDLSSVEILIENEYANTKKEGYVSYWYASNEFLAGDV